MKILQPSQKLRDLMEKTMGVVPLLTEGVARFKNKIKWALVYGSVARGQEDGSSDVDVMLIGSVSTMEVVPVFRRIEKIVGCPLNETIFSERDFRDSLKKKNHFLYTVMRGDYFEGCRRKRNVIDYTGVHIATATEAAEVLQHAREFREIVEAWIKAKHPQLA